ncbi:MAG TPA: S41 family peptidase [Thermoanaerobaculia bacterium]
MKTLISLFLALPLLAASPKDILDRTAVVLEEGFVDPARGREIARALREQKVAGDGPELAGAITRAIHSIENDGHLNVRFDPAKAGDPLVSAEEIRAQLTTPMQRRRIPEGTAPQPKGIGEPRMLDGNIGYLKLDEFPMPFDGDAAMRAAFAKIESAGAVILDLRECRGGAQPMVDFVASYFLPENHGPLLTSRFRALPEPRVARVVETPTRKLEDAKLYILISDRTFSAGEAFAYILQQFGRATIVGEKTRGGGRHNAFVPIGAGYTVSVSIATVEHPKTKTSWQGTGVVPDVATQPEAALDEALKLAKG